MPLVPGPAGGGAGVSRPAPGWLSGLGVLTCDISPGLVGEVTGLAGRREERRRLLPASAVVYFVLGLCLFSGADSFGPPGYRSVMRSQTNGQRDGAALPSGAALARGRERLGSKPFELLFDRCRGPLAEAGSPGAFAFGRRLAAWDGTDLDAADTPANRAGFGCHAGGGPKLRLAALIECGTRAVIDAASGSFARVHELALARQLLASLRTGMLLLADRQFPGWELWGLAAATGADLLWRTRNNLIFTPVQELPDGSCLAVMATPAENSRLALARHRGTVPDRIPDGHLIRVIEYRVDAASNSGRTWTSDQFRLVTTLLDPGEAPAAALAALYRQRWESETGYGELKTRLRGARFTLRSRTPDLTCQELLAFLAVYQALCALETQAARQAGTDPDRISFTTTLRVARDSASSHTASLTPASLTRARQQAISDILAAQLPARRDRHYERVASHAKDTRYPGRKPGQPRPPSQVTYTITITSGPRKTA
jgi:hypothetical protein